MHAFVHTVDIANVMIWYDAIRWWIFIMLKKIMERYDTIWDGILFVIVLTENDSLRAFKELVDLWRTRATPTNICGFKRKILMFSLVLYGYKRFIVCAYEELNWFKRNFNLFMQFRRDEARDVCEWVYIFLMNVRYHIHGLKRLLCSPETEGECEWERGRESTVMFFRGQRIFWRNHLFVHHEIKNLYDIFDVAHRQWSRLHWLYEWVTYLLRLHSWYDDLWWWVVSKCQVSIWNWLTCVHNK